MCSVLLVGSVALLAAHVVVNRDWALLDVGLVGAWLAGQAFASWTLKTHVDLRSRRLLENYWVLLRSRIRTVQAGDTGGS
jgi:uncharacterized membrane protein YeaQ/YmgE (transglycosylase-associated protein family)